MVAQLEQFDVVVVGAGMAGSALVAALADKGLRIALVEGGALPAEAPVRAESVNEFDPRVSALTERSRHLLEQVGAWPLIAGHGPSPYRHMTVWDAQGTGEIEFDCNLVDQPVLGHIVENRVINWSLQQQLKGGLMELFNPKRVTDLVCHANADPAAGEAVYELQLDSGERLAAGLLVAADGAVSTVRQLAGMKTREWSYQQTALVCSIQTELVHQETAWQRFLPDGPLALLPLATPDKPPVFSSIVWSTSPEHATELLNLDDDDFLLVLADATEHRLGKVLAASQRFSFPLRQRHAADYVRPGLALIADAAHSIHPLAGQGINLGFKDVAVLAEEISRGVERGLAPGDGQLLARYQRRRMADNLAMMGAMEGFKRLFGARQLPLRWLRNAGMSQLNQHDFLKAQIIRQAMGL